jgi:Protein of unknown function (DUF2550)
MPIADYIGVVVVLAAVVWLILTITRQRMLVRGRGGIPVAVRGRGARWRYGVGRYAGEELQWFGVLGLGNRPSRSLQRSELEVIGRHQVSADDRAALPAGAVIVELRDSAGPITLGLGEGAYTGFVSWLEATTPKI